MIDLVIFTSMDNVGPHRIWTSGVLRQHRVGGDTMHDRRLREPSIESEQALSPLARTLENRQWVAPNSLSIGANANSSSSLAQLRDTLFPKLISGEPGIRDTEKFIEAEA